jgi:hypothetical protein
MTTQQEASGRRVQITNYSPFRGLKGTIQRIHAIDDEAEEPFCFYLIALDSLRESIWFEHTEIEFLDGSPLAVARAKAEVHA